MSRPVFITVHKYRDGENTHLTDPITINPAQITCIDSYKNTLQITLSCGTKMLLADSFHDFNKIINVVQPITKENK